MRLYIDPGTGSMLFAILIGLLGVLYYALRGAAVKLRFLFGSGGRAKAAEKRLPFVIFSEGKRYWNVFEPVCRALDARGFDTVYMTASPDDPALAAPYPHLKAEFIGEENRAFARLNFLKATLVLSTTPGLDVYQWKRSRDVACYVHMLHSPNEVAGYRMFGLDFYDTVLLSGEYQARDVRALEALRKEPPKELAFIGVPYLDELARRLADAPPLPAHPRTVLLAPSWGASSIFNRFGGKIIDALLETGSHIIIRPHPQSFTSDKAMMEKLQADYPAGERLEWDRAPDNFESLRRADVMISDFSGVIFDFVLLFDKPVIWADTALDLSPYDAWWLETPYWTTTALKRIGPALTAEALPELGQILDAALGDDSYATGRREVREETWMYRGEGAKRAADYLIRKYGELTAEAEA